MSSVHPVAEATRVYDELSSGALPGVGHLLAYPDAGTAVPASDGAGASRCRAVPRAGAAIPTGDAVRLGFVGAGNYATSMLLPHLAKDPGASLHSGGHDQVAVDGQRPAQVRVRARHHGRGLGPGRPSVDAVFVVTRHRAHADFVIRALEHGKAVFVEKPLALDEDQLDRVVEAVERTGNDRLMVGFNRRFAPLVGELRKGVGRAALR